VTRHSDIYRAGSELRATMLNLDRYGDQTAFAGPPSETDFELLQLFVTARAALNALAKRHDELEAAALDAAVKAAAS
jgi:hypothetical protein